MKDKDQNRSIRQIPRSIVIVALLTIAMVRVVPLVVWFDSLTQDPDAYVALAEGWSASGTYGRLATDTSGKHYVNPTAYRPPLYPWVLSWLTKMDLSQYDPNQVIQATQLSRFAVAILHWILGVMTCWFALEITKHLTRRMDLALIAGILVAFDPILIRQSSLVMTETLATFLTSATWLWWCKADYKPGSLALGGILMGLCILCRPTAAVWVAAMGGWWLFKWICSPHVIPLRFAMITWIICGLTLAPWIMRNWIVFQKPIWSTTHGGYTLLLANNPLFFSHLAAGRLDRSWDEAQFHERWSLRHQNDPRKETFWLEESPQVDWSQANTMPATTAEATNPWMNEIREDHLAREAALASIARHPFEFGLSVPTRIGWLWAWWPSPLQSTSLQRWMIGAWYGLTFATWTCLAIANYRKHGKLVNATPLMLPGLLLVVTLTAVHALYWSNMRMRAVAMPAVYISIMSLLSTTFDRRDDS